MIADCDAKMARYRAAIDAGGDLEEITGWINEAKAERRPGRGRAPGDPYCAPPADPRRDQGRTPPGLAAIRAARRSGGCGAQVSRAAARGFRAGRAGAPQWPHQARPAGRGGIASRDFPVPVRPALAVAAEANADARPDAVRRPPRRAGPHR